MGGISIRKIYFDTETTGLDCTCCNIIELAMLVVENDEIVEEYDEFIKINGSLPAKITQITGITDDMLDKNGIDEKQVAYDLKERIIEDTVMIAHNAQFDLSFIYHMLFRYFGDEAVEILKNVDWLDTLTVLKDRKDYPHKLIDAVEHYSIEKVNFHRAIDDTKALYQVTQELKKERDDLDEYINLFGYNPKYPLRYDEKFEFINYKKQPYHNCGCLPANKILKYI